MIIIPITISKTDWTNFVRTSQKVLGYSPTRSLDSQNLLVNSPESFLSALGYFKNLEDDPRQIKSFTLKHVYISFLLEISESLYTDLLEFSYKNIYFIKSNENKNKNRVILIATSNLEGWKNICVSFNETFESKQFAYHIYEVLRTIGYTNIFNEYYLSENIDGTKSFEKRKT